MIRLDAEGAMQVVNAVETQIQAMEAAAKEINTQIVNNLPQYWEGNAHTKTQETYASEYQNFINKQVPEMVGQLKQYMQNCVQTIKSVDEQLAGK